MSTFFFSPPFKPGVAGHGPDALFPVRSVFCVGRDDEAPARETGVAGEREAPFHVTKAGEHVVASGSEVPDPPGAAKGHHAMERVVAIGQLGFQGRGVPAPTAQLSRFHHLQAGELICTGTPAGVGAVGAGVRTAGLIEGLGAISSRIGPARMTLGPAE